MTDDGGVLGNLPNSRPGKTKREAGFRRHRRRRPPAEAAAKAEAGRKGGREARAHLEGRAHEPEAGADGGGRRLGPGRAGARPPKRQAARIRLQPEPSGDAVTAAARTAAGLAVAGVRVAGAVTQRAAPAAAAPVGLNAALSP